MTRFIKTSDGDLNLNCVVRAERRHDSAGRYTHTDITYREGRQLAQTRTNVRYEIRDYALPVIPAAPGFFVVAIFAEEPYDTYMQPVIAWRVEPHFATPICPGDDPTEDSNPWGILRPDGKVEVPFDCTHNSVAEFQREESQKLRYKGRMTEKADRPYEVYKAGGWTDEQLIGEGFMKPAA